MGFKWPTVAFDDKRLGGMEGNTVSGTPRVHDKFASGGLDRRIPDKQSLSDEVAAWIDSRNKRHARADWQFTPADAGIEFRKLYPAL